MTAEADVPQSSSQSHCNKRSFDVERDPRIPKRMMTSRTRFSISTRTVITPDGIQAQLFAVHQAGSSYDVLCRSQARASSGATRVRRAKTESVYCYWMTRDHDTVAMLRDLLRDLARRDLEVRLALKLESVVSFLIRNRRRRFMMLRFSKAPSDMVNVVLHLLRLWMARTRVKGMIRLTVATVICIAVRVESVMQIVNLLHSFQGRLEVHICMTGQMPPADTTVALSSFSGTESSGGSELQSLPRGAMVSRTPRLEASFCLGWANRR